MNRHFLQELPPVVVAAAVIYQNGKILLTRRNLEADQGGLWEFPGGKREAEETLVHCLKRELKEEIDIIVGDVQPFCTIRHRYPEKEVELHFFTCSIEKGNPMPLDCLEMVWVSPDELQVYTFPAADQPVLKKILQRFSDKALNPKA